MMYKVITCFLALCWLAAGVPGNQTQQQNVDLGNITSTTSTSTTISSTTARTTRTISNTRTTTRTITTTKPKVKVNALVKVPVQPWQIIVSVQVKLNVGYKHLCGGTIIAEQFVLTAAHCFIQYPATRYLRHLSIAAGTNLLHSATSALRVPIKAVVTHGNFVPLKGYDIALVQLSKSLPLLQDPARFRRVTYDQTTKPFGLDAILVGWGRVKLGEPKRLESLHFKTMHNAKCRSMGFIYETKTEICAMNLRGRGACDGDSGGPLVSVDLRVLYGMLSYGKKACQQGKPYAFTRISPFVNWIKDTMARLSWQSKPNPRTNPQPKPKPNPKPKGK